MQEPSPFGRYVDDMQGAVLSCKKDPLFWYPQGAEGQVHDPLRGQHQSVCHSAPH